MEIIAKSKTVIKNYFIKIIKLLADPIVTFLTKRVTYEVIQFIPPLIEFYNSSDKDKQSYYDHTKNPLDNLQVYENLKQRLVALNVPVEDFSIDISDFENWLKSFPEVANSYRGMGDVFIEKCLEHYLSYRLLNIKNNDVYIDIAAAGSDFADILHRSMGVKSYVLDLTYPEGVHGNKIGADAGATKLPDKFANVLSLHCAYECFMGDADIRFIKEASRILAPKGRYLIVPLYMDDVCFVATSPFCNQKEITIEDEALKVWRDDKYIVPFSRHYSPEAFKRRIFSVIPSDINAKVIYIQNIADVIKYFGNQRIYCFFTFYCEKKDINYTQQSLVATPSPTR